jgi:DNA invertase Pin-like site-specific DNA recombinase
MSTDTYNAAIYVRLSKEDGDKAESNSIVNQKELIKDYLRSMPEIRLCSVRVDDGFSGVDFSRPAFEAMMEDIRAGLINCVVVKDFSRFGRNYIEVGRYLENIFPFLGVRFISVNDNYDTAKKRSDSDDLIVPFKNLMNDAYSRDISVKIRSQLLVKRKKGDYIGNFVVYGYEKSAENKNKLVVDEYAAEVVRDIFRWKIEGLSQQGIADRLNDRGELSPMEYKRYHGMNFATSFKKNSKALWTARAVGRVLNNPIYTGVLEQGKVTTPNHKLKNRIVKSKTEWNICEDAHEPIISKQIFDVVAGLLLSDTRIAPNGNAVYVFSGLLFCADCGNNMVRKTVPSNGKKYIYYVCSTKKSGKGCTLHSTSETELMDIVFTAIKKHIASVLDLEEILLYIKSLSHKEKEIQKLNVGLTLRGEEIERYQNLKLSVYEDFKDGILDKQEYLDFNALYGAKLKDAEKAALKLKSGLEIILSGDDRTQRWIGEFTHYRNINELTRKVIVSLIERISVTEDGIIDITFLYNDKFQATADVVSRLMKTPAERKAV